MPPLPHVSDTCSPASPYLPDLLDLMEELVFILDPGGRMTYVNPACERALGHTRAEILTRTAEDFVAPEDIGRYRTAGKRIQAGGTVAGFEAVLLAKSGARIVCQGKARPHMEGGVYAGALIICTDVTAERHAEATLRESERRFHNVLESVRAIAITLDRAGNVVFANDYLLELTGWTREEIVGTNWFDHFVPETDTAMAAFERAMTSGETRMHSERVIRTRKGDELLIEWDHTILRDVSGRMIGTASLGHDLTERRRAERLKNELISIVSHELRTPIGIVHGALDFLRDQVTLTGQPAEFLAMAVRNTDRALLLLNDLLYLERLESGRLPLEWHPVSVAELLSVAYEATQGMAQHNKVSIAIEATGAVSETTISVDARRMQQLLVNLISNAIKFSPAGETVTLSADLPGDGMVHVAVRDHGCGIPANMLDRVFDRFVQVHAHAAERRGAGLGLAIAKAIAETHEGRIWVESSVGGGSAFHFTVPINADLTR